MDLIRMGNNGMGRGRRSPPLNDRFRDRGMMPGRGGGDRFPDQGNFSDGFRGPGMGPMGMGVRIGEGEPFPKQGRFDNSREPLPPVDTMGPPKINDCEIIVLNKTLQRYAELVEQRLKNIGLLVDLLFIRDEGSILRAINDIAKRGSFYAAVITHQNEMHGSLTLNILQGPAPQEHRNMPMDDALKLVARTFSQMRQEKRSSGQPPIDREIHFILNLLMSGKYLTIPELDRILRFVQDIRDRQAIAENVAMGPNTNSTLASLVSAASDKGPDGSNISLAEQQNLQERILSILNQGNSSGSGLGVSGIGGTGAGMNKPPVGLGQQSPSTTSTNQASKTMGSTATNLGSTGPNSSTPSSSASSSSTYINFDNPSVQKALDSLISSGPSLLKSLSNSGGTSNPNTPTMTAMNPNNNMGPPHNMSSVQGSGNIPLLGNQQGPQMNPFQQGPNMMGGMGPNQGNFRPPLMGGNQGPFFNQRGPIGNMRY